jgi:hypothetical protein
MDRAKISAAESRARRLLGEFFHEDGTCVTIVAGTHPKVILQAFGARLQATPSGDVKEFANLVALWETRSAAVIVAQAGGSRGAQEDVLRAASSGARAATVYWDCGNCLLAMAQGTEVLLRASGCSYPDEIPIALARYFAELDFANWRACALLVAERFTHERFVGAVGAPTLHRLPSPAD